MEDFRFREIRQFSVFVEFSLRETLGVDGVAGTHDDVTENLFSDVVSRYHLSAFKYPVVGFGDFVGGLKSFFEI